MRKFTEILCLILVLLSLSIRNGLARWIQAGGAIDGEADGDGSGRAVAIGADGTITAIGTRYNDGNGSNSGHVRVFQYQSGTRVQLGSDIDGLAPGDDFGTSLSLSADGLTLAIGAHRR